MYQVGNGMVLISKAMINKIRTWAINPFKSSREIDVKMVRLLLVKLVGMANLAKHNVDDDVKAFIKGNRTLFRWKRHKNDAMFLFVAFLVARADTDELERIERLNEYIINICNYYAAQQK